MKVSKPKGKQSSKKSTRRKLIVFISHHADGDGELAVKLKQWLETQYQTKNIEVFVSSSENDGTTRNSIQSGTIAKEAIAKKLANHDVLISLFTPTSIERPWVIFESGIGFGRGRTFIPILCKGLDWDSIDIHNPLKDLEVRNAQDPKKFDTILYEIDKALGRKHTNVGVEDLRKCLCSTATPRRGRHLMKDCVLAAQNHGGGVLVTKGLDGSFHPVGEYDPHTICDTPHDKLSNQIAEDCDGNRISLD